ncbi:MAG: hypothetical protein D6820_09910 [Lentisphaerae bacterium]|nr:MAG: hypothetical protein D6820_09910 [Lentisphaerota bacterium]
MWIGAEFRDRNDHLSVGDWRLHANGLRLFWDGRGTLNTPRPAIGWMVIVCEQGQAPNQRQKKGTPGVICARWLFSSSTVVLIINLALFLLHHHIFLYCLDGTPSSLLPAIFKMNAIFRTSQER